MRQIFYEEFVAPLGHRLGTLAAGWAVHYGATSDQAALIVGGAVAAGGLGVDLILSHYRRKRNKRRAN